MCGVAGVFTTNQSVMQDRQSICQVLKKRIDFRGPDGQGVLELFFASAYLLFLHKRLAITDNSDAASQPMMSRCQRFLMVFNGEIYNTNELKLFLPGFSFKTESDTELLLELFSKIGEKVIDLLEGIFAIAIFDQQTNSLFLATDHLAIKPLYYFFDGATFAFASSAKALAALDVVTSKLDEKAEEKFYAFGSVFGEQTVFKNVKKLGAGESLSIMLDHNLSLSKKRYFSLESSFTKKRIIKSYDVTKKCLQEKIFEVVSQQMPTKVDAGFLLSSGIDSSLLCAVAARLGFKFDTFSVGFDESCGYRSEVLAAQKFSKNIGVKSHSLIVSKSQALDYLDQFFQACDQPSSDGFNSFLAATVAGEKCKVIISGLGADELFFGYWFHPKLLRQSSIQNIAAKIFPANFAKTADVLPGYRLLPSVNKELRFVDSFLNTLDCDFDQMLSCFELLFYDQFTLLPDSDNFFMQKAIECRVPFLDRRLIELALEIPAWKKFNSFFYPASKKKNILLEILQELAPFYQQVSKQGFELPIFEWLGITGDSWDEKMLQFRTLSWRNYWLKQDRQC